MRGGADRTAGRAFILSQDDHICVSRTERPSLLGPDAPLELFGGDFRLDLAHLQVPQPGPQAREPIEGWEIQQKEAPEHRSGEPLEIVRNRRQHTTKFLTFD